MIKQTDERSEKVLKAEQKKAVEKFTCGVKTAESQAKNRH